MRLLKKYRRDEISFLVKGALWGVFIRISAVSSAFISSAILARHLGVDNYGLYAFIISLISIASIPSQMGLPTIIIRETAASVQIKNWSKVKGIWIWAAKFIIISSVVASFVWFFTYLLFRDYSSNHVNVAPYAVAIIVLSSLSAARSAALKGLKRFFLASFPDDVFRHLVMIILVVSIQYLFEDRLSVQSAVLFSAISSLLAFILGGAFLSKVKPKEISLQLMAEYDSYRWLRSVIPLGLVSGLWVIRETNSIIFLSLLDSHGAAGVFKVAMSLSALSLFAMTAITMVLQPQIASLHAAGKAEEIKILVPLASSAAAIFSAVSLLAVFLTGKYIIDIFYGPAFGSSYVPTIIIFSGYLVSSLFGMSAVLLSMTNNEAYSMKSAIVSVGVQVILNIVLIPKYGILGACFANVSASILNALQMWAYARKSIGVNASPLSLLGGNFRKGKK